MRGSHSSEWRVRRTERGCIDGRPCVLLPLPCLLKSARGAYTWHGVIGMQFLKIHTAGSNFIVCDAADLPDALFEKTAHGEETPVRMGEILGYAHKK